ncbi:MAG TPA: class I SAM-dependent methyltransferase [Pyrinomonadaceae bacterium]|nr:class I SAM-dependent methyltransferase [Pyrinomonadaceae bacterium]
MGDAADKMDLIASERTRIEAEYQRRERELAPDLYAPWQPAEMLSGSSRKRIAAALLHRNGVFPRVGDKCLEIGVGNLGWLGDLISWGVHERDIYGIELQTSRVEHVHEILPCCDVRTGDASALPWPDNSFHLVIASTVISSILEQKIRRQVAAEITRVIQPGGALLWYDFAYNNPRNPSVRRIYRSELKELFPDLHGPIRRITLAPPIARFVVPKSWPLAVLLETVPFLRTHLLAVLRKN